MIFKTNSEGQRVAVIPANPLGSYLTGFLHGKANHGTVRTGLSGEEVAEIHENLDFLLSETDEGMQQMLAEYDIIGKIRFATLCFGAAKDSVIAKGVKVPDPQPLSTFYQLIDQIKTGAGAGMGVAGFTVRFVAYENAHVGTWAEITEE